MHKMNKVRYPKAKFYHSPDGKTIAVCTNSRGEKIKAVAKWNPEDEYSAEVGEAIAYKRLLRKWLKSKIREYHESEMFLSSFQKSIEKDREEAFLARQRYTLALEELNLDTEI